MEYPVNLTRYDPEMISDMIDAQVKKGGPGSGRRPGSRNLRPNGHRTTNAGHHIVSPKARAAASARFRAMNQVRRGRSSRG